MRNEEDEAKQQSVFSFPEQEETTPRLPVANRNAGSETSMSGCSLLLLVGVQ